MSDLRNAGGEHEQVRSKQTQVDRSKESVEPPVVYGALSSPGQPLGSDTQSFFERRFGHDFSQVRAHTDASAIESARAVNAQAYTVGSHVVFGDGQYAPNTLNGRRLLAHEMAHVVQQRAAGAPAVIQRQQEDEQQQQQGGAAPQAQPLPQPSGQGPAQVVQQQQQQRPWTPRIPYIWFDLHDSFR